MNNDKERAEFERVVSKMFSVDEYSFKRDGSFGPYLYMVTSQNYPGQPSGGEFIKTQSLWNLWQASAERSAARIAEIEAEVVRLKADSERLSWLSRVDYDYLSFELHHDNPHDGQVQIIYGDRSDGDYDFGKNFRDAIDNAMAKGGA